MRIFLDHAASTPIDNRVLKSMKPFLTKKWANPSSIYEEGVFLRKTINESRKKIAKILACQEREVIFTGSGTESDNLAILGVFESARKKGIEKPHFVTTSIEHPAVLESFKEVERRGGQVSIISPDKSGVVLAKEIAREINEKTVLVSVMFANNEIGTIQPIKEISRFIREFREKNKTPYPYFHTDASQAPNFFKVDLPRLGVDLLTLDASKMYGPKGVGILVRRFQVELHPIIFGGGQEFNLRSGTENTALIVGVAKALELAEASAEKETSRLIPLRDFFIEEVLQKFPGARLNGDREKRLPNNVSFCFPKIDSEFLCISLAERGILVSPGSSCSSMSENDFSYVLKSIGSEECSRSSVRFTFGQKTRKRHLKKAIRELEYILKRML